MSTCVFSLYLRRQNSLRKNGSEREIIVGVNDADRDKYERNGVFDSVEEAKREKGDKWSGYRYTL